MGDTLEHLRELTGLEKRDFALQLCQRAGKDFRDGILGFTPRPEWLERAAAKWLDFPRAERNIMTQYYAHAQPISLKNGQFIKKRSMA
mgnify:CR=1 FL=1